MGIETREGDDLPEKKFTDQLLDLIPKNTESVCLILISNQENKFKCNELKYILNIINIDFYSSGIWDQNELNINSLKMAITKEENLYLLNPYHYLGPCTENMFFGREMDFKLITSNPKTSYCIVGPRKIGKTSFLFNFKKKLSKFGGQTFLYLDCSGITTYQEFYSNLINMISAKHHYAMEENRVNYALDDIIMRAASSLKRRYVIALDEFDRIATLPDSRFENLRAIINSPKLRGRCRFIVSGYDHLWTSLENRKSYLFNLFPKIVLSEFTIRESAKFIQKTLNELNIPVGQSKDSISLIVKYSGQLPWLIQAICFKIVEDYSINPQLPSKEYVIRAINSNQVQEAVFETTTMNSSPLGNVILSCIAEDKGSNELAINKRLKSYGLKISLEDIMREIKILNISGAIKRHEKNYELSTYILKHYLTKYWRLDDVVETFIQ